MSKSIKISEEVYKRILQFADKRETFSQAIERLLDIKDGMCHVKNIIAGGQKFEEWQQEQHEKQG